MSANAAAAAGVPAGCYLSREIVVRATAPANLRRVKEAVTAKCPAGTAIVAGGAASDGVAHDVALTTSAPDGSDDWVAEAATVGMPGAP